LWESTLSFLGSKDDRTMPDATNPYLAPQYSEAGLAKEPGFEGKNAMRLYVAWPVVFALNLVMPGLFGLMSTDGAGRVGMLVGTCFLLVCGFWICSSARNIGFALVVGGVPVALSQVVPIIQMVAGTLAFAFAEALGLVGPGGAMGTATSAAGGFVLTLTTGGLLMAAALVAGLALRALRALFR
jgi:hypothetical protein